MLQKPSQVVSEQILTLYFKHQSFSSNHLLQMSSDVSSVFSTASLSWGLVAPVFKDQTGPQGPLYSVIKMVQNQQTSQLILLL